MAEHVLKTWPNAYDAVAQGTKRFEWRKDDRGFEVGDVLVLRKFDPRPTHEGGGYVPLPLAHGKYTEQRVRVTYILRGQFGVPPDYCVMSIEPDGVLGTKVCPECKGSGDKDCIPPKP